MCSRPKLLLSHAGSLFTESEFAIRSVNCWCECVRAVNRWDNASRYKTGMG